MLVHVNTDNHIVGTTELTDYITELLESELERFSERIARVEVFLADENADKQSDDDKRCTMEARIEGLKAVAVTHFAGSIHQAVEGATNKLKKSIGHLLDRVIDRQRAAEDNTLDA